MNKKQSFSALLERYVLAVANNFIEAATPDQQSSLIHLITSSDRSVTDTVELAAEVGQDHTEPSTCTPFDQLEQQWHLALTTDQEKPLLTSHCHLAQSIAINQRQIEQLSSQVDQMAILLKRAETTIAHHQTRTKLMTHYQTIYRQQVTYLGKLQVLQAEATALVNK